MLWNTPACAYTDHISVAYFKSALEIDNFHRVLVPRCRHYRLHLFSIINFLILFINCIQFSIYLFISIKIVLFLINNIYLVVTKYCKSHL